MSNTAIRIENLSKRYHIGQGKTARYETLSDRIVDVVRAPFRSMTSVLRGQSSAVPTDTIWALKDVSFEVQHGEVVGIIGRNGAGKSTLLKILSQITEPTEGHIDLYGRVGALLEVGTGFHPELTGRENVFLNGAILGMSRNDIQRKFAEIVDFSGVETFIDTPVKHYSTGMQVRLAFAVAAHLEPEILVVDEVLAVGDAEFQKKCLGKMGDVTREGRTVLFVSHNMGAVRNLTTKSIFLRNGEIISFDLTDQIVNKYLTESLEKGTKEQTDLSFYRRSKRDEGYLDIISIRVEGPLVRESELPIGASLMVYIGLNISVGVCNVGFTIVIKNAEGNRVAVIASWDSEFKISLDPGFQTISVCLEDIPLAPGQYFADFGVGELGSFAYDVLLDVPFAKLVNYDQVIHWLQRSWGAIHWSKVEWQLEA